MARQIFSSNSVPPEGGLNIREIARRAGCSSSTVSRVLAHRAQDGAVKISEATSSRILAVCAELNYTPSIHAARLFSHRSRVIGLLPPCNIGWDDPNLSRALGATCHRFSEAGYRCLPLQHDPHFFEQKGHLLIFRRNEIDGLIIWGEIRDEPYLHELSDAGMPFILSTNRIAEYPAVIPDQRTPIRQLTRRCQEKGAERLVYLDFCAPSVNSGTCNDTYEQRRQGFLDSAGPDGVILPAGLTVQDGYRAAAKALAHKPDAIIAGNDRLAVGTECLLRERGMRIPEDILVTGGDNIELSEYCAIPISTFDQRSADCAERCAEILLGHLDRKQPLVSEILPTQTIFRASTGD